MTDLVIKFWYPEIVEDISKITDAMEYYRAILNDGQRYLDVKGFLQKLLEQQAGLLRIYSDAHTDCSMVWKWLDETIKHEKAKKRLWYHSREGREEYGELKKTDLDVIINADTDIKDLIDLQLMIELWKNSLGQLVEQLKSRGITLAMIAKVRMSGEHEAFVDATKETNPERLD